MTPLFHRQLQSSCHLRAVPQAFTFDKICIKAPRVRAWPTADPSAPPFDRNDDLHPRAPVVSASCARASHLSSEWAVSFVVNELISAAAEGSRLRVFDCLNDREHRDEDALSSDS